MNAIWLPPGRAAPLVAALLVGMSACSPEHPKFKSIDVTGADWGKSLSLKDAGGTARTLEDFRGKLVVLTFGFTHCPDVCPTTLADVASALKEIKLSQGVQVLFVTLDPERDTPEVLAKYVRAFDPSFLALHGDLEATRRTAGEFKIYFEKRRSDTPGAYSVDHAAQSYVLDDQGRLRLLVKHERIGQDLAHDLKELLREQARRKEAT